MPPLQKDMAVITADGVEIGQAVRVYRRTLVENIDPERKLFERYLFVFDIDLPLYFYVPLEYIADIDAGNNRVNLRLTRRQVDTLLLQRRPQFIAAGLAEAEPLPEGVPA